MIPPMIHDTILEKNKKFWLSKYIFNKTYIDSVFNIFKDIKIEIDDDYQKAREQDLQQLQGGQFEMFKFLTTFFLTSVIRAKERKAVPSYMKIIREALQKNINLSLWLVENFCNQDLIKELIIDCPIPDMKRFVVGLLGTAMKSIYRHEAFMVEQYANFTEIEQIAFIKRTQM